jgi:hypothetical protein
MGIDNDLTCVECKEYICIARNGSVSSRHEDLAALSAFLQKHAEHTLIFARDDNYPRVPDSKMYDPQGEDLEFLQKYKRYASCAGPEYLKGTQPPFKYCRCGKLSTI